MSRRDFGRASAATALVVASLLVANNDAVQAAPSPRLNIPFVQQFETVDQVPKSYFDQHKSIYAYVERVIDGDTIRVRHIPAYKFRLIEPVPLEKRGIAEETLSIRIYGVDTPEVAKRGQAAQPFAEEAKEFTSNFCFHRMVKITFLRKDQYRRAVCVVQTLGRGGFLLNWFPGLRPRDLSIELASAGLAELYTGGGAEYNVSLVRFLCSSSSVHLSCFGRR